MPRGKKTPATTTRRTAGSRTATAPAIIDRSFEDEMQESYLDYSLSVIIARAIPDVRDGLKPVHRRILWAMRQMHNTHDQPHKKSARVVGEVLGKFHPHGDVSVYDALVRMAQEFSMRYPLIDGHGNFGSADGDSAAAMRYCVVGDTLVVTDRGLIPIDTMAHGEESEIHAKVLSVFDQENGADRWFNSGTHPTRRVRTRRGYEIVGTMNHPLLTLTAAEDGRPDLTWKLIENIKPGDWIVLDRGGQLWPSENVDLKDYWPDASVYARAQIHTLPKHLDERFARILGAFVAEGTFSKQAFEFTQVLGDFATHFQEMWPAVFPTCRLHIFERQAVGYGRKPFLQMLVVSKHVRDFLSNVGLHGKSAGLRVPEVVLRSPKGVVASFLSGLYEGDGAVEQSGRSLLRITLASSSHEMLRQVQTLLLRFGIVSTLSSERTRPGQHRLHIIGEQNLRLFAAEIGFVSTSKRTALQRVIDTYSGKALSQTDFLPYLAAYVRENASIEHRGWLARHNFDRSDRLIDALPRLREAVPKAMASGLGRLIDANYLYESVVAVEDAGDQQVYSIRVKSDCHSFVANGFVNHNTETRLTPLAEEMLAGIDKNTVAMGRNFDETLDEPLVLPGGFPNLLVNGVSGIAVGMSTNIPPHNLGEVIDATVALIQDKNIQDRDLAMLVKGPDFPTGGVIVGRDGLREAYLTGRGRIVVRGVAEIESAKGGKEQVVISALPYGVTKTQVISAIQKHMEKRTSAFDGIADVRDESGHDGMRFIVETKRSVEAAPILKALFAHTPLETSFSVVMLALDNSVPKVMNLRTILQKYIDHAEEVARRKAQFDLDTAKRRLHVVNGLMLAVDILDEVIKTIRRSKSAKEANEALMALLKIDHDQAQAILGIRLQQLTNLEITALTREQKELHAEIKRLESLLANRKKILATVSESLQEVKAKYGDPRRTKIIAK